MIIIIEGIDGAGKTMLANKLRDQTGYMILHRSHKTDADPNRVFDEYMQVIESGKNCIMDRAWYSEMVYGPVMRDASLINYPQMYALEKALAKRGAIVIHCTGSLKSLWKRCMERGEDYLVDPDKYRDIYNGYETLMNEVPHLVPVVQYEYTGM